MKKQLNKNRKHNKSWACIKPEGDGCDENHYSEIEKEAEKCGDDSSCDLATNDDEQALFKTGVEFGFKRGCAYMQADTDLANLELSNWQQEATSLTNENIILTNENVKLSSNLRKAVRNLNEIVSQIYQGGIIDYMNENSSFKDEFNSRFKKAENFLQSQNLKDKS